MRAFSHCNSGGALRDCDLGSPQEAGRKGLAVAQMCAASVGKRCKALSRNKDREMYVNE